MSPDRPGARRYLVLLDAISYNSASTAVMAHPVGDMQHGLLNPELAGFAREGYSLSDMQGLAEETATYLVLGRRS